MSKVLVDRELLEYLAEMGDEAIQRMGSYLAEKHGEQRYVDAARAILAAQPEDAEGLEVVAWLLEGGRFYKHSVVTTEAEADRRIAERRDSTVKSALVRLSAITAPPATDAPEGYVLLPKQCPSWLEDAYDECCEADQHFEAGLYLPAYDAMVEALASQRKEG